MNCTEINFLRNEKINLQFRIQCLEGKVINIEILYCESIKKGKFVTKIFFSDNV